MSSICADWVTADTDRYLGPFDKNTANPVLVVGNRFDPATRYEGALTVDALLPNSRLLTVEGWGHTSLFLSACADAPGKQLSADIRRPSQLDLHAGLHALRSLSVGGWRPRGFGPVGASALTTRRG